MPAFTGGTLQVDTNGRATRRTPRSTPRAPTGWTSAATAPRSRVFFDAVPGTPGSVTIGNSETGGRIVSGVNTYTGTTLIDAGANLAVDGWIVSPVTVNGTLRHRPDRRRTTAANGSTLAPGDGPAR